MSEGADADRGRAEAVRGSKAAALGFLLGVLLVALARRAGTAQVVRGS